MHLILLWFFDKLSNSLINYNYDTKSHNYKIKTHSYELKVIIVTQKMKLAVM